MRLPHRCSPVPSWLLGMSKIPHHARNPLVGAFKATADADDADQELADVETVSAAMQENSRFLRLMKASGLA